MSIELDNLTISTGDVVSYIIIGFLAVIIYSSRTLIDLAFRRLTCRLFKHDFENISVINLTYLQCRRCRKISHDYNEIRP